MPKPWAKYEVDFINHDKFRAISAPAICLWLEGKNYADKKLTDGLLPLHAVKLFRFYSVKNVTSLTGSIGPKSAGDRAEFFAPLWEVIEGLGWKMHHYLEHNDCRDVVAQRMFEGQHRKAKDKQRKADARAAKKAKADSRVRAASADTHADSPRTNGLVHEKSTSIQNTEDTRHTKQDQEHTHVRARGATLFGPEHRSHAQCGRVCIPAFLHRAFRASLGGNEDAADQRLRVWYDQVLDALPADEPCPEDGVKFWRPQFQATFVKARPNGKTAQQETDELLAEIRRQDAAGKP